MLCIPTLRTLPGKTDLIEVCRCAFMLGPVDYLSKEAFSGKAKNFDDRSIGEGFRSTASTRPHGV